MHAAVARHGARRDLGTRGSGDEWSRGGTSGDIVALVLEDGRRVAVAAGDMVVLATGARTRSLLTPIGLTVPGLTVVASHLLAAPSVARYMLLGLGGGPNVVPQFSADGRPISIFGSSDRFLVAAKQDNCPVAPDPNTVATLREEIRAWFGMGVPSHAMAWTGRKTEIHDENQVRSQAHHVVQLTSNAMLFLPGKLSASWVGAVDLARRIFGEVLPATYGRSIWKASHAPSVGTSSQRLPRVAAITSAASLAAASDVVLSLFS